MDRYTKIVLTVIAISLVWLSLRDFVEPAYAVMGQDVKVLGGAVAKRKQGDEYPGIAKLRENHYWLGGPIPVTIVDDCSGQK